MEADQQWRLWVQRLVEGDDQVVREFWGEYGARMRGLAARLLNERFHRREEPEDVVQSVCRTFFRRAADGQFELASQNSLWRLLCAITAAKSREKARFHQRQKRSAGQDQRLPTALDDGEIVAASDPSPAEEAAFADELEKLLSELTPDERTVVELRLQDCEYKEIAQQTGIAYRTVKRMTQRIRAKWQGALEESCW